MRGAHLYTLLSERTGFVSTWKTDNIGTSNDDQISLPLEAGGTYDFDVWWGDGSSDTITVWNQAEVTHTYSTAGTYKVKILRTINGWRFNDGGDELKLTTVVNWGDLIISNNNGSFWGCENLVVNATDCLDVSSITSFSYTFYGCSSLSALNVSGWDTSSVLTLDGVFTSCPLLNGIDVSGWDVSNVTTLEAVFNGCSSLTSLDVSGWDVSNVTTMAGAFHTCSGLTTIGIDNWDITSVTSMFNMFVGVTLTTANYDAILIAWAAQVVNPNVQFHAGNSKYTGGGAAAAARAVLTGAPNNWVITDNGIA